MSTYVRPSFNLSVHLSIMLSFPTQRHTCQPQVCCFVVYSTRQFVLSYVLCNFLLVFFSPFSIAIISLWEDRANLSAFRTFVWFPLPLGVWERLRLVIVALLPFFLPTLIFTLIQHTTDWQHFLFFRRKIAFGTSTECRLSSQLALNVKAYFREKTRKISSACRLLSLSRD